MKTLSPSEALTITEHDLEDYLPRRVRDVLLDLVLEWARLDTSFAFLAAAVSGLAPDEGADAYGRAFANEKLKRIARKFRDEGRMEDAANLERLKAALPPFAKLRNRVAHARCIGMRRSVRDQIVFLPYEREGPPGHLAMEIYEVAHFEEARDFAAEFYRIVMGIVNEAGFFEGEP